MRFQSTPPVRVATLRAGTFGRQRIISIHATREGGDLAALCITSKTKISIHATREGGDIITNRQPSNQLISIHATREGGDPVKWQ